MDFRELFDLAPHGADTYVGVGPQYPWGGLYGGQIVAQALRAAASTVGEGLLPHSLRAYFLRRGDHTEPVRYEVDRIRDGRSFCTRRVIARQAVGVILHLEASFVSADGGVDDLSFTAMPTSVPAPESLTGDAWSTMFDRRQLTEDQRAAVNGSARPGAVAWYRSTSDLGTDPLLHLSTLAFLSDELSGEVAYRAHPLGVPDVEQSPIFIASLDHTIWFHRPARMDAWHLFDVSCHTFVADRCLTIGHVFSESGVHVATFAQEVLARLAR